jgi:hypothetical protein
MTLITKELEFVLTKGSLYVAWYIVHTIENIVVDNNNY